MKNIAAISIKKELLMMNEGKLFTVDEVLTKSGGPLPLSKSGVYAAIKNGYIPVVQIGKRLFIPGWYLDQLLSMPSA